MCPIPQAQTCGGEDILYIYFLIFPGYLEFWTPLPIPIWASPLGCTCYTMSCLRLGYWLALSVWLYLPFTIPVLLYVDSNSDSEACLEVFGSLAGYST